MSEIYEGNSITVNNINKSKAKIKNRGGSWQEATAGYQLFDWNGVSTPTIATYENGVAKLIWTGGFDVFFLNNSEQYLSDLDTTKEYTISFKHKGNAIRILNYATSQYNVDTNNDKDYAKYSFTVTGVSSIRLDAIKKDTSGTAYIKELMVYEGTDDKLYEPYTGGTPSPNPNYPQEIQNVGDNINILNKEVVDFSSNSRSNTLPTGVRLIANTEGTYIYSGFTIGKEELVGKTICIHTDMETNNGNPAIRVFSGNSNSPAKTKIKDIFNPLRTNYVTLPEKFGDDEDRISVLLYVTTKTSVPVGTFVDYTNLKVQVGKGEVVYSDYNCGSVGVTIGNKNLYKIEKVINDSNAPGFIFLREGNLEFTTGGIPLIIAPTKTKEKTEYTYILKCKSNVSTENNINFTGIYEDGTREILSANRKRDTNEFIVKFKTSKEKTLAYVIQQYTDSASSTIITEGTMILEGDYLNLDEPYEIHQEQEIIFPLAKGQKLYEGSYLAADGIHNTRKQATLKPKASQIGAVMVNTETKNTSFLIYNNIFDNLKKGYPPRAPLCNKLQGTASTNYRNFNNQITQWYDTSADFCVAIQTDLVGTTNDSIVSYISNNQFVLEYFLEKEEIIPYTPEQQNAFYQLQNIVLYDGINHISTDNELGSMSVEVSKIIEDYETYISSNGFFINSQNDIHYLIDFSESELPCMAEATETTVKAAGRNGDIVLSTTYDPNNFNIVCYTEDNLTQEEKVKEEMKLKKLLNSIKNKTIPLAFEKDDKFYKVKYSGAFSSTNFPKHLKFSIPLKTSESYGKDLIKKVIFGNGEETSDTFEDVGAIFTIKGPANSPIISLNDYSIEYDNPLLEGDKLIINSSNSTITHINSDGVKTNAMRYYNHQFPKIENGKNVLKVLSGVNEANVSVEWYDYKF